MVRLSTRIGAHSNPYIEMLPINLIFDIKSTRLHEKQIYIPALMSLSEMTKYQMKFDGFINHLKHASTNHTKFQLHRENKNE